jgi:hypothetical protein
MKEVCAVLQSCRFASYPTHSFIFTFGLLSQYFVNQDHQFVTVMAENVETLNRVDSTKLY